MAMEDALQAWFDSLHAMIQRSKKTVVVQLLDTATKFTMLPDMEYVTTFYSNGLLYYGFMHPSSTYILISSSTPMDVHTAWLDLLEIQRLHNLRFNLPDMGGVKIKLSTSGLALQVDVQRHITSIMARIGIDYDRIAATISHAVDPLATISRDFAICATAHKYAWVKVMEMRDGHSIDDSTRQLRDRLHLLDIIRADLVLMTLASFWTKSREVVQVMAPLYQEINKVIASARFPNVGEVASSVELDTLKAHAHAVIEQHQEALQDIESWSLPMYLRVNELKQTSDWIMYRKERLIRSCKLIESGELRSPVEGYHCSSIFISRVDAPNGDLYYHLLDNGTLHIQAPVMHKLPGLLQSLIGAKIEHIPFVLLQFDMGIDPLEQLTLRFGDKEIILNPQEFRHQALETLSNKSTGFEKIFQ